ncbi:MAG: hypothetical protein ABIO35_08240 [Nitrobacter sp.]
MVDAATSQATGQSSTQGTSQATGDSGTSAAQGAGSQQTQSSQATTGQTQAAADKPVRPEWLPENYWDGEKNEPKGADFRKSFDELTAFKAAQDSARLSRPQAAADYKTELPKDWKAPEGLEYKLNPDDPMVAQYREFALEAGLDQEKFEKGLGLVAALQVGELQQIKTARDAEITKLGANGSARVDAALTWMKANGFVEMPKMLVTAGIVGEVEKLIQKFTSQGAASFNAAHREQAQTKMSEADYEKLSPRQKFEYAQKFDQSQFNGARQ